MQLFGLLDQTIGVYGQTYDIALGWLGEVIRWLIEGVGSVGLGVILFSVILRVVVLPFDVMQRVTMRKQNVKMKQNKEAMEKLQKQYANNKDLYNQKVSEMYKKEGLSMFSSCLPMILSLVIFIVAINNFTAYSQFATVQNYNKLVNAYNAELLTYAPSTQENYQITDDGSNVYVREDGKILYYSVVKPSDAYTAESLDNTPVYEKTYYVDHAVAYATYQTEIDALLEDPATATAEQKELASKDYLINLAQTAVIEAYEQVETKTSFLWIKNIWATDVSFKHPVLNYTEFETSIKQSGGCGGCGTIKTDLQGMAGNAYTEGTYEIVTKKLTTQKAEANGYYILVVLSIGTILLQQFVTMRSQKEQSQFSSVDGQGAMNQKTMMIMMTVMFAFFSFIYSAAFSIYMIMSNVLSLATTLVINKLVDISERKKEEKAFQDRYNKRFRATKSATEKDKKDKK